MLFAFKTVVSFWCALIAAAFFIVEPLSDIGWLAEPAYSADLACLLIAGPIWLGLWFPIAVRFALEERKK